MLAIADEVQKKERRSNNKVVVFTWEVIQALEVDTISLVDERSLKQTQA